MSNKLDSYRGTIFIHLNLKKFLQFASFVILTACQSSFIAPEKTQWNQTLSGTSFGTMTTSRRLSQNTALKQAGYRPQNRKTISQIMKKDAKKLREKLEPSNIRVHLAGRDIILTLFSDQVFQNRLGLNLNPQFYNELSEISHYLAENRNTYVEITGYTDAVGNANANQRLSIEKARRLTLYFVQDGHNSLRFFINGRGESSPIADNNDSKMRSMNRRLDIRISPMVE
ncbi:MAG: OmpA family protein [Alphaproteobacteria bacterium]